MNRLLNVSQLLHTINRKCILNLLNYRRLNYWKYLAFVLFLILNDLSK